MIEVRDQSQTIVDHGKCWNIPQPHIISNYQVGLLIGHIKRLSTDGESVTFKVKINTQQMLCGHIDDL